MTNRRKFVWLALGFSVLVASYYVLFLQSLGNSFGAAMSPNGGQSNFDAIIQSVFSFPFFYTTRIFSLAADSNVLIKICTFFNGLFWALVVTFPIGVITLRSR